MMTQSGITNSHRQVIADRLIRLKIPSTGAYTEYAEAGGLMSYGPSAENNYRRAAGYVDRIFKGANPGDLPVEQPTLFELVVNMKTAKAMRITFPQSFLIRVDRVIE